MTALARRGSDTHTARPGRPARYGGVFAAVAVAALVGYAGVAMAGVEPDTGKAPDAPVDAEPAAGLAPVDAEPAGLPREGRVALVIGNGRYEHVSEDPAGPNDAQDVGASLERLGFTVTTLLDAGYMDMVRGLVKFAQEAQYAEAAVVFYAGHGFAAEGRNFLVPVDMAPLGPPLTQENLGLIPAQSLVRSVAGASRLRLVVLDTDVHASLEPAGGTIVAQAARWGDAWSGPENGHSPYTEALLRHLEDPELELGMLFRKVRADVVRATEGRQEPAVHGLPGWGVYLGSNLGSMPSLPPALEPDLQDPAEEQPAR